MINIERYAYANRLRSVHPAEKFAFALCTMIICLAASSIITSLVTILLMAATLVLRAGIPGRFYLKLMLLPASFLVIGVITVAVSVSRNPGPDLHGIAIGGVTIGTTARELGLAAQLFFKSLGTVSCLYFLSLTTPMTEIIPVLKKLKVSPFFIELMGLIYRFIFVLAETADKIHTTQSSRWGYATLKNSYVSLGQLISNLFIKSFHRSRLLFITMESRCYTEELKVIEVPFTFSPVNIMIIVLIELALVTLALYNGGGGFYG